MGKSHREQVLDYLWSIAPDYATNSHIRDETGISSHQQVFMLTRELMHKGLIHGEQRGREWVFWADESPTAHFVSRGRPGSREAVTNEMGRLSPAAFEDLARAVMGRRLDALLTRGQVPGVPKEWDMVSLDRCVVGDAKYFTLVGGQRLPPAKFSVIAEHVWLLEKTGAPTTFLVFGNDRQVPELWLKRYGSLVSSVTFYFLTDNGRLESLNGVQHPAHS